MTANLRSRKGVEDPDLRPLLVGEDNPRSWGPEMALLPVPANGAGGRLARILKLTDREYLRTFQRINLCSHGSWDAAEARSRAHAIKWSAHPPVVILLGRKVWDAFEWDEVPYAPFTTVASKGHVFIVLPHPSGRCRVWNDPRSAVRARALLRKYGALRRRVKISRKEALR